MRYVILVALIGFVGFGLGLIIFGLATPGTRVASADPPDASEHLVDTYSIFREGYVAGWVLVRDLVDGATASLRGRMHRTIQTESLPQ